MGRDFYILIAFCVFMFMLGVRLKRRWNNRKQKAAHTRVNKNQRPKMAASDEPPLVRERRLRRERRTRYFTIILLFVLFGLMAFMIPALIRDLMQPEGLEISNLFLRCLIFVFTIYIFVLGYLKVFRKKGKVNQE